jgi:hypothetical protein
MSNNKPKAKYRTVGSVLKSKDGKPDYIKISQDVTLREGQFVNLVSKASKIAGIDKAEADGKLSEELATKLREQAEKMPDFVRFNLEVREE